MDPRLKSLGLIGIGVAVGAFVGVPLLHQIGHDPSDHVHTAGGIVDNDHAPAPADAKSDPQERDASTGHSGGSLAHFSAAVDKVDAAVHVTDETIVTRPPEPEPPPPITPDAQSTHHARAPPTP